MACNDETALALRADADDDVSDQPCTPRGMFGAPQQAKPSETPAQTPPEEPGQIGFGQSPELMPEDEAKEEISSISSRATTESMDTFRKTGPRKRKQTPVSTPTPSTKPDPPEAAMSRCSKMGSKSPSTPGSPERPVAPGPPEEQSVAEPGSPVRRALVAPTQTSVGPHSSESGLRVIVSSFNENPSRRPLRRTQEKAKRRFETEARRILECRFEEYQYDDIYHNYVDDENLFGAVCRMLKARAQDNKRIRARDIDNLKSLYRASD